jgi:molecular chaperone DnaK
MPITRAKLESLVQPIIDRCREPVNRAVADAGLTPQQIDNIILVGGPTRMPIVQKFVESYFGKTPERGVDPMECVAMGAAIQGGIMGGEVKSGMVLVDVTPLTLGIETLGGVVTEMIKRNTAVPISKTQTFTTASDSQTQVEIHVLQGERPMAKDNMSLGRFILDGIAPARRGEPQIEVSYDIDANGIVHVTAKDKATGKEQHITIENATKLKDDEIERMKREAEQFADQDKRVKEEVELKNRADQVVFSGRKTLTENAAKISPDVKAEAEKKLTELEDLVRDNKTSDIEAKIDEVNTAFSKVTEDLQHEAGEQGPAAAQENQSEAQQPPQDGQTVEGQGTPKP